MDSMRPCHRKARRTQPVFPSDYCSSMIASEHRGAVFRVMPQSLRVAVVFPQLVEELLEMCWETELGAEALLKPFAHGIADRAAGTPVDLFAVIGE